MVFFREFSDEQFETVGILSGLVVQNAVRSADARERMVLFAVFPEGSGVKRLGLQPQQRIRLLNRLNEGIESLCERLRVCPHKLFKRMPESGNRHCYGQRILIGDDDVVLLFTHKHYVPLYCALNGFPYRSSLMKHRKTASPSVFKQVEDPV